jgi:hypothetical protein
MSQVAPSFEELTKFITTAASKGWIGSVSGAAMLSALRRVAPVLEDREKSDVNAIDIDALIRRFSNLNREVGGSSLKSYSSRISSARKMFLEWRNDPKTWKPRATAPTSGVGKRAKNLRKDEKPGSNLQSESEMEKPDGGENRLSYPFPLRDGVVVKLIGLPPDLTQGDVERITRFLRVLCVD